MREALMWGKLNQILAGQKKLDEFLVQQKYIVADLIMKMRFLESKLHVSEGEYEDFKKEFVSKLEKYREDLKSSQIRSESPRADGDSCEDSRCKLPGNEGN